jgi:hypothetical protein
MKHGIIIAILLFSALNASSQKVFEVKYESRADLKVFVVDYESRADLCVYVVDYESRADKPGLWYWVDYESRADKKIFFVEYESRADLKIFYVEYESRAGWTSEEKKYQYENKGNHVFQGLNRSKNIEKPFNLN